MKPPPRPHSGSASLPFGAPQHPADVYTAHVDGAARGNPGPASYACIVRAPDGTTAWQIGKYIGRTTNNVAEYYGLIAALDYATEHGVARLRVISDSELMVKQMKGQYRVKSPDLQPLYERAKKLARGLAFFAIEHVRRAHNSDADALANVALDRTSSSGHSAAAGGASAVSAAPNRTSSSWVSALDRPSSADVSSTRDKPTPSAASPAADTPTSSTAPTLSRPAGTGPAIPQSVSVPSVSAPSASARSSTRSNTRSARSPEHSESATDDARLSRVAREALKGAGTGADTHAPREQRVKARYANGALHPLDPIDLAEGDTVELRIRKK